MKKPKTKDLFVKGTRICLGLIFFGISCFWGYQACLKVKTPPVGTRLQYRYGDDFKGNVEIMALTVCPDALWFYKFMEGKVKNIQEDSLDSITSSPPSVKIQIMGGKVGLRCKGKTLLVVVNKLFVRQRPAMFDQKHF